MPTDDQVAAALDRASDGLATLAPGCTAWRVPELASALGVSDFVLVFTLAGLSRRRMRVRWVSDTDCVVTVLRPL